MIQVKAPLLLHRRVAPEHFLMRLLAPVIAREARPGQFLHIRVGSGDNPLLRRPISLLNADRQAGTVDLIYKVVGSGTAVLAKLPAGGRLDLLGPLGHPFEIPGGLQEAFLAGGGVGIPPLYFLAKELVKSRGSGGKVKVRVFLGARTKEWLICGDLFKRLKVETRVATDDGSLGRKGSVVDLMKAALRMSSPRKRGSDSPFRGNDEVMLFMCGPTPMMAAGAALARRKGLRAQVSLEERMGCAMGCCLGCVVEVAAEPASSHARFQRVCTEGPVFPAEAVVWSRS
ncbi:MAG: dihydroorotate dehydrogenase electron transfer subunit [Candidatus Omnitrophica bacterium]|nr:dihydroorotate dehydrogenase electron transfer subunit [Candidatus Omnitrophota bacterium]